LAALPLQRIEGKYEILEKIREGGMGAIYKVRHRLLDEIRVIKLMRQQLVEDEELKARFLREARLAIKLRHPNIAQLYDYTVDDDGTAFIVMEFIDGMTLEDVLSFHGPPPLGVALEIAQQSLKALGYLHSKGLIHRDISPDNLMLTGDADDQPLVKLIDLGIAKIQGTGGESHLTQTGTFLGKIRYAPPEQFGADGASMVDSRGDLYSFGVVLYELLTARFPIQGKDPSSLIAGHLFRPPLDFAETDPAGRIPADLRAVVFKALAKDPDERYATAAELSRALAPFRSPGDVAEEALPKLLTRPFIRVGATFLADPGSTQERLDHNFDLAPTPSPGNLLHLAKTATPTPSHREPPDKSDTVRKGSGTFALPPETTPLPRTGSEWARGSEAGNAQPGPGTFRDPFTTALAGIESALELKDYSAAESMLAGAEASFGEREELSALHERMSELRRLDLEARKRQEEIVGLIAAALELAAREDFHGALEELGRAALLDPDHAEVSALREQAEASLLLQEEREERERKQRQEERWREEEARAARVQTLLSEARVRAAAERLDEALAALRQAADLFPGHSEVRDLTEEVQTALRWQEQEKRRASELALAAALESHLDCGELTKAAQLLERTVVAHGDRSPLRELQTRLQTLRDRAAEKSVAQDEERLSLSRRPEAVEDIALPVPMAPDREPVRRHATETPVTVPPLAAIPRPSPRSHWGRWLGVAAVLLVALGGVRLIWFRAAPAVRENPVLSREQPEVPPQQPQPAPPSSPAASSPPPILETVPVEQGLLVIDALPWAEVVRVEGLDGKALEIGPNHFTPLTLQVPTGRYQVVLKNPSSPGERKVSAMVVADGKGKSEPAFVAFNRVSAEEYFRDLGF
jgi:serine/threonine protein kinase